MAKMNRYLTTANNLVVAGHQGMSAVYMPRVKVCQQILYLSSHAISEAFDGVVGEAQIEGIRHAMIEDLSEDTRPVSSWREVAARLNGRSEHESLD